MRGLQTDKVVVYERRKVFDGILRLIHAWNGLAVSGLLLTAWISEFFEKGPREKGLWQLHIFLGYGLIAGLAARLLWGLFGPEEARLSRLWHPREWITAVRRRDFRLRERFGHQPVASAAYVGFYLLVFGMAFSGLFLAGIEQGLGPLAARFFDEMGLKHLFKEPHELGSYLIAGFIATHVIALIWHERKHGVPLAQEMVSGYQYRRIREATRDIGEA